MILNSTLTIWVVIYKMLRGNIVSSHFQNELEADNLIERWNQENQITFVGKHKIELPL